MKVSNSSSAPVQGNEAAATKAAKKTAKSQSAQGASSAAASTEVGGMSASISSKAKDAAKAKEIADSAPDVREAKIAALRQKIAENKYKVDAEAVADRLVDDHLEMSGLG